MGKLDDLEALERFPTQESIRTSVELIEGLTHCLADEKALAQFDQGGLYYKQAATLGHPAARRGRRHRVACRQPLRPGGGHLGLAWPRACAAKTRTSCKLVRVLRLALHRIMTAATEAYHKQSNAELDRLAHTDALTGLYNRRYWEPELERYVELYKRYRHPFAILMLDFDNLKWVNDTFGHAAGDTALHPSGARSCA